jgi:archaellum biogenesis ATPase FlaH
MLALHEILQRFDAPKKRGKDYRTRCPAHPDTNPSLDIMAGDTGIVFICRSAGCAPRDILAAVGLTWADVLPDRPTNGRQSQTMYDYRDASGQLQCQVIRKPDKSFPGRRPDGKGGWTWSLEGVPRFPYRLPELAGHARVWLVEGEKDADRLWRVGLPATCNRGGGGQWGAEESAFLKTTGVQRVVLLQDADAKGAAHVATAARHLEAVGITTLTLPPFPGVPANGGDVSNWLDLGHTVADLEALLASHVPVAPRPARQITLTAADTIRVRPVRWLWDERLALGTLCLVGGREGVGKSILTYTLAAHMTQGTLPGVYLGLEKSVIVAAMEDSWEHTIVPRLMAAGANLARVHRVDVTTADGNESTLQLPADLKELQRVITEESAALLVLDPLLSRLSTDLDTHKDADVRVALEPVVKIADASGCAAIGLIHVNKSASSDPLTLLMGSRAFAAVARSVLFVMADPDEPTKRLMGQAKNNLGRVDLPALAFQIQPAKVADTPEGAVWTGKLEWLGDATRTLADAIAVSAGTATEQVERNEAAEWLEQYLQSVGGACDSTIVKKAGNRAGHSTRTLTRARQKLGLTVSTYGFPKQTGWALPVGP